MGEVQGKIISLTTHVKSIDDAQQKLMSRPATHDIATVTRVPHPSTNLLSVGATNSFTSTLPLGPPSKSWAERSQISPSRATVDADGFTVVTTRKSTPKKSVLCGKKVLRDDSKVKALPRRLTVFVGRLDLETPEDDLMDYLKDCGIEDATCKKLKAKDGRVFKTSAFMVMCDCRFRSLLYDEAIWPAGSEMRDWVFHSRSSVGEDLK